MDIETDGSTLVLSGAFDVRSTMEVRNALYDLLARHDGDVVVDLAGVESIDVTALRVLGAATHQAARAGRRLTLRGCRPAVRRLLHMSRMIRVVDLERAAASA